MTRSLRATPPAGPALEAESLGRAYGDVVALRPQDITVRGGELVALVGPNGAGKTTLLTMAAGLLQPSSGMVRVAGSVAGSLEARAAASYVPDTPVFYDDLSLDEHLEYVARLHGVAEWASGATELLEHFGLEEWREYLPSQFSRGMRQKASLAIGFIRPFSLLLADEPFDGLDPPSRGALIELLERARADGAAVMVSTHRAEVIEIATRFLALHDGESIYDGPPDRSILAGDAPQLDEPVSAPPAEAIPIVPEPAEDSVSLSTATFEDLRALGMSAPQALELLRYRETWGPLNSVDRLADIPGFGADLVAKVKRRASA